MCSDLDNLLLPVGFQLHLLLHPLQHKTTTQQCLSLHVKKKYAKKKSPLEYILDGVFCSKQKDRHTNTHLEVSKVLLRAELQLQFRFQLQCRYQHHRELKHRKNQSNSHCSLLRNVKKKILFRELTSIGSTVGIATGTWNKTCSNAFGVKLLEDLTADSPSQ